MPMDYTDCIKIQLIKYEKLEHIKYILIQIHTLMHVALNCYKIC